MAETCPTCRKPTQPQFKPFCSNRCAQVDLHRWFGENYRAETRERDFPETTEADET